MKNFIILFLVTILLSSCFGAKSEQDTESAEQPDVKEETKEENETMLIPDEPEVLQDVEEVSTENQTEAKLGEDTTDSGKNSDELSDTPEPLSDNEATNESAIELVDEVSDETVIWEELIDELFEE